jgi:hypothetical protein
VCPVCVLQEYVSLSFSPDGKMLLAQGGAPDWSLLLWTWEKSKIASSVRSTNLQGSPVVKVRWAVLALPSAHACNCDKTQQPCRKACSAGRHVQTTAHTFLHPCRPASARGRAGW